MLGAKIINGFKNLNILCIGDIMLDKFLYGEVERISPEAPVPIFKVTKEKSMLGGTGNVIANLAALGVQTMFIGAAGNDESSVMLEHFLDKTGCNYSLIKPDNYPTTTKIRMIASNNHLLRADKESFLNADESVLKELSEMLEKVVDKADIVLVSDYKKGLLTLQSTQMIIQTCKKHGKKVLLDPKERDFSKYAGADIVKPNLKEFELVSGKKFDTSSATFKQEIKQEALAVMKQYNIHSLLITLSKDGMIFISSDSTKEPVHIPAEAKEVFDVSETSAKDRQQPQEAKTMRELVSAMIDASPVGFQPVEELEVPAFYDSSQQTIFIRTGLSEEQLFVSMAKEVSAAVFDFKHNESRDASDFKSFCVAYMVSSRYGVDTRGFNFGRLPKEYEGMDTQAFKGELGSMRDVLGEIQSDMYKSMEKNKPPKSKEQER